jgi:hypothetical protein
MTRKESFASTKVSLPLLKRLERIEDLVKYVFYYSTVPTNTNQTEMLLRFYYLVYWRQHNEHFYILFCSANIKITILNIHPLIRLYTQYAFTVSKEVKKN